MRPPSAILLPNSLTVGLPLFVIFILLVLDLAMPPSEFRAVWIDSELGVIENLTALLGLFGMVCALVGARRAARLKLPWLILWHLLLTVGFFYLASEEASWGQHWVPWETPEWLAERNRYGEANLHNFSYGADRIPKSIVGAGIVIFGIGWPLFRAHLEPRIPSRLGWLTRILPSRDAMPMAIGFFIMWLINRSFVWLDFNQRSGDGFAGQEHMELLMSTYLFLYALALATSLKDHPADAAARAPG